MPYYRYKCDACGHSFRELELQSTNGDSVKVCENCGKKKARRVISRVEVVYKGSGYHCTDYGSKSKAGKEVKSGDNNSSNNGSKD